MTKHQCLNHAKRNRVAGTGVPMYDKALMLELVMGLDMLFGSSLGDAF